MLPLEDNLINQVLFEFHSSKVGGHAGVAKTIARICSQFSWSGMHHVRECQICQQGKVQ